MSQERKEGIKKMAELLRSGAVMLSQKCPVENCSFPLFRLRTGEVVCPVHGRVYLVKSDEEAREIMSKISLTKTLDKLEEKIIQILNQSIQSFRNTDYRDLIGWLEVLERIRRIKKEIENP